MISEVVFEDAGFTLQWILAGKYHQGPGMGLNIRGDSVHRGCSVRDSD